MAEVLRITGGTRRGRKLESPPLDTIRPASDLVRQAVFNMLFDAIPGCAFHDIYAGTGIVGIEALSRGAKVAYFLDRDGKQVALIKRNLRKVEFGPEQAVERGGDSFVWAKHFTPEPDCHNIVFLGPPYPDFETQFDQMLELVATVQARLKDNDYLVLQFPRFVHAEKLPDPDHWYRLRQYGKTQVGIWQRNRKRRNVDAQTDGGDNESIDNDNDQADNA